MMDEPLIFGVVGSSDSGKTELTCRLIEHFKGLGYKVASIKHTRGDFSIDSEGKDTWRHSEAGADLVVFSTPNESDLLLKRHLELDELISIMDKIDGPDIFIVEGMKEADIPKISVDKKFEETAWLHYENDIEPIIEAIEKEIELKKILVKLAGLDCGECGHPDCKSLARSILKGENSVEDCTKLKNKERVRLKIDDEEIRLGSFPEKVVERTIRGLISSLKDIDGDEEKIEIEIKEEG